MPTPNVARYPENLPTQEDISSAADAMVVLENNREDDGSLQIGAARLSAPLVDLMSDLFSIIARGETVTYAPLSRRLTTQEAADILNVSRPYLIKLIDRKELSHEMVGTHRRIPLQEVLAYKETLYKQRGKALEEMQEIAEELDDA